MFKGNQIWLMTFLDLLILMVCFFVLFYSIHASQLSKNSETSIFGDKELKTNNQQISAVLRLIYDNLQLHYNNNTGLGTLELSKNPEYVRIIPVIDIENTQKVDKVTKELSEHIFNFTKNTIRVTLLFNYEKLLEAAAQKNENIDLKLKSISKKFQEFRDKLAANANNETIEAYMDIHSLHPLLKDKDWLLITDILPEAN
jgi:hypothetical protein